MFDSPEKKSKKLKVYISVKKFVYRCKYLKFFQFMDISFFSALRFYSGQKIQFYFENTSTRTYRSVFCDPHTEGIPKNLNIIEILDVATHFSSKKTRLYFFI